MASGHVINETRPRHQHPREPSIHRGSPKATRARAVDVTIVDGASVLGLVSSPDGVSVAGVRLSDKVVTSDLAVVATGRADQLPAWAGIIGVPGAR